MLTFYINPPSDLTSGETAYFLTTFINQRQSIAPKMEAVCSKGELRVTSPEGVTYDDLEHVIAAFVDEMVKEGTASQVAEARELAANLDDYADGVNEEYADGVNS